MFPTQKCFRAGHPAVAQLHLGLQVDLELTPLQGPIHLVHQLFFLQVLFLGPLVVELVAVAEVSLFMLAGQVGLLLHLRQGFVGVVRQVDAEIEVQAEGALLRTAVLVGVQIDPLQPGNDLRLIPVFQQEVKHIAEVPGHRLILPQVSLQLLIHIHQGPVALRGTEHLVDELELQQVHRHQSVAMYLFPQQLLGRQPETGVIHAAGQAVVKGQPLQLLFTLAAVHHQNHQAGKEQQDHRAGQDQIVGGKHIDPHTDDVAGQYGHNGPVPILQRLIAHHELPPVFHNLDESGLVDSDVLLDLLSCLAVVLDAQHTVVNQRAHQVVLLRLGHHSQVPQHYKGGASALKAVIAEQLLQDTLALDPHQDGGVLHVLLRHAVDQHILLRYGQQLFRASFQLIHVNGGAGMDLHQPLCRLLRRVKKDQLVVFRVALLPLQKAPGLLRLKEDGTVPQHPKGLHRTVDPAVDILRDLERYIAQILRGPVPHKPVGLQGVVKKQKRHHADHQEQQSEQYIGVPLFPPHQPINQSHSNLLLSTKGLPYPPAFDRSVPRGTLQAAGACRNPEHTGLPGDFDAIPVILRLF